MRANFIKTAVFALFSLLSISAFTTASAEPQYNVTTAKNYYAKFKAQQPIDIGLDVHGVKLDSVFFDKSNLQAFIILMNRTPVAVSAEVGVSVFDSKGKLIASGIDVTGFSFTGDKVDPGKQKNVKLSFDKFLNDFSNAATFQLVFSIYEEVVSKSSGASTSDDDF